MSFSVTPTNLVLITGKKSMVLFILPEIIDLKNQEKNGRKTRTLVLFKFIIPLTTFFGYLELNLFISCIILQKIQLKIEDIQEARKFESFRVFTLH